MYGSTTLPFSPLSSQAHIVALLLSKFSSYQDFHTQLYTCSAEFDFLSPSYALALSATLLLPMGSVVVGLVVWRMVGGLRRRGWRVQEEEGTPPTAADLSEVL